MIAIDERRSSCGDGEKSTADSPGPVDWGTRMEKTEG